MKTLVIWFIDKATVAIFVLLLIGAFLFGYMGGDLVTTIGLQLGIEESALIREDAEAIRILFGVIALLTAFIVGSLIFGFIFLMLNMEKTKCNLIELVETKNN